MKNNQHDPLPWAVEADAPWIIVSADGRIVARLTEHDDTPRPGRPAEGDRLANWPNAALIVAAVNSHAAHAARRSHNVDLTMNVVMDAVYEWAQGTFPERTMGSMALKLYEEIGEWLRDPTNELEFADVMIMLLDAAKKNGINDISGAIIEKLEINRQRSWSVSGLGVMSHDT